MKQIVYMAGEPVKHPGETGRELPLQPFKGFNDLEIEHIYLSAGRIEVFFQHIFRLQSLKEAYEELMDACENIKGLYDKRRLERRIRAYFLEADVFLSHWRKFLGKTKRSDCYKSIEKQFGNDTYQLLRIARNYVMHSGDIMHGSHIGFDGVLLWADRDILKKDIRDRQDRAVLDRQPGKIDCIKLVQDSFPLVREMHEKFLESIVDEQCKEDCRYLASMAGKTVMINSNTWYIFKYTGIESVKGQLPIIGEKAGMGIDFVRLDWQGYRKLNEWINKI